MRQRRLRWLLVVLAILLIARILVPPHTETPPLAEALVRKAPPVPPARTITYDVPTERRPGELPPSGPRDYDLPGDAFAVRPPPAPPYVPAVPLVAQAKVKPAPTPVVPVTFVEPPPPPVPYQVIGTWDDGKGFGVFLASGTVTLLARAGVVLQSEYKVMAVTPQQVSLLNLASKREILLPVPNVPQSPRQQFLIP